MKNTEKFISVSQFRSNNIKEYLKLPDDKFSVLLNCCDSEAILKKASQEDKDEIRKKYNIKPQDKIIVYMGRIVPEKGVLELIKAIKLIRNEQFKLLIIGASLNSLKIKTKYEDEIEKNIQDIKDKVSIVGFVNHNELYKYYSVADISVVPSMCDDSAPLTIIEDVVAGIPIITTKSGGIPEYVDNSCAYILERDDNLIENMSNKIKELLNNEEIRDRMKKNNKIKAQKISEKDYYHNFIKLITMKEDEEN